MSRTINKMPTLGYFNKVACDVLGLWTSDNKDTVFNVPATEKERRKALREAFEAIKREDGSLGNIHDLISVTTKISPKDKQENKKNKTIQDYINYLSKEDFYSRDEFIETKEYIDIIINERFSEKQLSIFASRFYKSSVMHYREFIREHASKTTDLAESYSYFARYIFANLIDSSEDTKFSNSSDQNSKWPLRSFADAAAEICGVSLHKLHQFHELKLNNNISDKEIWSKDLTGQPVNSRTKQIVDRLRKSNKTSWDRFCFLLNPLICLLPEEISEEEFWLEAYSAFLAHNINLHITELKSIEVLSAASSQEYCYPKAVNNMSYLPVSDTIDLLLNYETISDTDDINKLLDSYKNFVEKLRLLDSSLIKDSSVPSTIDYSYNKEYLGFPVRTWSENLNETPLWIDEWVLAKTAVLSGDSTTALQHYKKALDKAKYVAGALFAPLYVEICAFCKHQYQELKQKNEEHLFDRFYEPLGGDAAKYAALLGYAPGFARNSNTLMPILLSPIKHKIMMRKIDSMS